MSHEDAITVTDKLIEQAVARRMGWQPIETAPKDGTWLLLYLGHNSVPDVGRWFQGDAYGGWWVSHAMRVMPTHWMELPAPPSARLTDQEEGQ